MSQSEYLSRHRHRIRERAQQQQTERSADARSERHYYAAMDVKMEKWSNEHPGATLGETLCAITSAGLDLLCRRPMFVSRRVEEPYTGAIAVDACWPPVTQITITTEEPKS